MGGGEFKEFLLSDLTESWGKFGEIVDDEIHGWWL